MKTLVLVRITLRVVKGGRCKGTLSSSILPKIEGLVKEVIHNFSGLILDWGDGENAAHSASIFGSSPRREEIHC
ncbi:MAG: hypothetical protein UX17_C0018G0011 [Parcubacteria group bacterium GW2011_GWC2_45_7]|uniref:Uncharacterized protein n=1 Tax=Candidatus Magasanikbacteria bacterium GW2011_GWA2_50_22 TaxID=1619043 RepID=A0A0G1WFH1_9BACT|nr:MAG: hypothetical protein UX17_C0018G0011 [Parcubacteria group bacterium GW2011_GWC2_45_7]KKW17541.1 MAG: hypothetical protein UY58_C0002G0027 [Candidatus Magasanikbacteria bacterium GW2011_GWA2_50_22]